MIFFEYWILYLFKKTPKSEGFSLSPPVYNLEIYLLLCHAISSATFQSYQCSKLKNNEINLLLKFKLKIKNFI